MRVESYVRDYDTSAYTIVGKDYMRMHEFSPRHCQALEVEFYSGYTKIETDEQWEKYVFPYIDSDMFRDTELSPGQQDYFVGNYKSILRGHVPGWEIMSIDVSPTAIMFDFFNAEINGINGRDGIHGMYGFLGIFETADLRLEVKGPELSSGIRPEYTIGLHGNQTSYIHEDMGDRVRRINLRIKVPKKYNNILNQWSILADITEYECI